MKQGEIILVAGNVETRLARLTDIPSVQLGNEPFRIDTVLAALAAGWALKMPLGLLIAGIKAFEQEALHARGRAGNGRRVAGQRVGQGIAQGLRVQRQGDKDGHQAKGQGARSFHKGSWLVVLGGISGRWAGDATGFKANAMVPGRPPRPAFRRITNW